MGKMMRGNKTAKASAGRATTKAKKTDDKKKMMRGGTAKKKMMRGGTAKAKK